MHKRHCPISNIILSLACTIFIMLAMACDTDTEDPGCGDQPPVTKILFAIDCSGSMGAAGEGSDPGNRRLDAVQGFIDAYSDDPNVYIEVMLWNQGIYRATMVDGDRGFTKDTEELNRVLTDVVNTGTTDYLGTLEAIHQDIARDIGNTTIPSNTSYMVLFFSDSLDYAPETDGPRVAEIISAVEGLVSMTDNGNVNNFVLDTALLRGIDMTDQDYVVGSELLIKMSQTGRGGFFVFDSAAEIQETSFVNIIQIQ